ncbi:MAG: sterol desaturase family protein [Gammaproteobacteria bacterium]|jgi:sterol desaturase/sphingolipid hydroxylase (fatty acid hydroxylase superfamily)|nr:MAG: sterol desaturase family protein [Gammaproteobacteria bacterium]|tara:strand:- start:549 stop:1814 length:1266 start_codon:yes stop_codon:yes gene_type:complete
METVGSFDSSIIITLAVPAFFILIFIELIYGLASGKSNYRLNDTFTSISLGLISRYIPLLGLGIQGAAFAYVAQYYNLKLFSPSSIWVWVFAFFLYDFCYYWMHRLHHEVKVLWATHVVHHHGEEFNLSTALRQTSTGFLWKWIFYLPIFIVGIPPEVFVTVAGVNLVYQFWVHTEHIPKLGWYEYIFVSPSNHRIHHAQNKHYVDANYGGVFILWDRLFGTYKEELEELKPIYGTAKPLKSWNPFKANLDIFREMLVDSTRTKSFKDKIKVWFSRPNWRPEDVKDKYPIIKNDLDNFKPYNPEVSSEVKIYGWIQLLFLLVISAVITSTVGAQTYLETSLFALILTASCTISLVAFENYNLKVFPEVVKSIVVLALIFPGNILNNELLVTQLMLFQSLLNLVLITVLSLVPKKIFSNSRN